MNWKRYISGTLIIVTFVICTCLVWNACKYENPIDAHAVVNLAKRERPQCKFDPVKSTTGTSGLSGFAGGRGINVNCDIINTSKGAGHPDSVGITSYNLDTQLYYEMPYKTNYTSSWDSGQVDTYQAAVYTQGYGRIAIGVKVYTGSCISTLVYGENYYKTPSCTACDTVVRDDSFVTQKIINSVLRY